MSDPRRDTLRRWLPPAATWVAALALAAASSVVALARYREFRSAYPWDLAYYNQWFWALTHGDGIISVRPVAWYALEGPSVWEMNYLAPIRFLLVPFYLLDPGPEILLILQNVVFWWVVPAAYTLVRAESRSTALGLAAAILVPATPLLWPLVWNDFRELQLALPFALWAIAGYRGRDRRLAALGIAGLLACRQEFAVVVATLAVVPPREPEPVARRLRWAGAVVALGAFWIALFFAYLMVVESPETPLEFLQRLERPERSVGAVLAGSADLLAVGLGSWALLACLAPRVAILAVPWVWSIVRDGWTLQRIGIAEDWHHVRYAAPATALVLAAGLLGFARLGSWLRSRPRGRRLVPVLVVAVAVGLAVPGWELATRFAQVQPPIAPAEAAALWTWITRVGPEEGVLAGYDVAAPLSSRRHLYSNYAPVNYPPGFPILRPEIQWVFLRRDLFTPQGFLSQGFEVVYRGPLYLILHRERPRPGPVGQASRAAAGCPPSTTPSGVLDYVI